MNKIEGGVLAVDAFAMKRHAFKPLKFAVSRMFTCGEY